MALTIFSYHSEEQLSEYMHAFYAQQQKAQLFGAQPRLITLSQPINRWVNYKLALRYGATLDVPCQLMEDGLWSLLRECSPIQLPAAMSFQQWLMRLVCLLSDEDLMGLPVMEPLYNYLQNHPQQSVPASKIVSLVQTLILLFQDYEQRSPDLLADWPDSALAHAERELYIRSHGGNPCSLGGAFSLLKNTAPVISALPRLTTIIGFPAIQQGQWRLLEWASQAADIHLLQFQPLNPCPPELEIWDRPTQQFLQAVDFTPAADSKQPNQRLAALQNLVKEGRLSLLCAKGTDREYEAVANHILQLLDRDPSLLPQHIAVLCPDVADVKSSLCTAFDRYHPHLPYCVMGVRAGDSLYIQALQALLALTSDNFTRSQLLSIMRNPCFMQAQSITHGIVENWQVLMSNTGAWRGYDQVESAYEQIKELPFSFKQMLQRYRLGRLMQVPGGQQSDHWQHRIPEAMNRTGAQELETLGICLERLDMLADLLSGPDRTTSVWAEQLMEILPTLIQPQPDESPDRRGQSQLINALRMMCDLDEPISLRVMKAADFKQLLSACIRPESWHLGVPILGGVNVGSLNQLEGIPFRHVIVCGLNEGSFPKRSRATSLDVRTDMGTQSEDIIRQSLLIALFSASEGITLSYQGLNPVADTPGYLSNQVRQLLEYLGVTDVQQITRDVPLMPYSPEHVLAQPNRTESAWPNYNRSDWLVALKQLCNNRLAAPELVTQAKTALEKMLADTEQDESPANSLEPPQEISVKQLSSYLYDPINATLERLAGRVWEELPEDAADTEPLELRSQQITQLVSQAIQQQHLSGQELPVITSQLYQAASHRGLLPVAPMEQVLVALCQKKAEELSTSMPVGELLPIHANVDIDGVKLTAEWPLCIRNSQGMLFAVKLAQGKKNSGKLYPFALVEPALTLLVHAMQNGISPVEAQVLLCWTGDSPAELFTIRFKPEYLQQLLEHYLSLTLWHIPYPLVQQTGMDVAIQDLVDAQETQYNSSIDPLSWVDGITQPESDEQLRLTLRQRFAPFAAPQKTKEGE